MLLIVINWIHLASTGLDVLFHSVAPKFWNRFKNNADIISPYSHCRFVNNNNNNDNNILFVGTFQGTQRPKSQYAHKFWIYPLWPAHYIGMHAALIPEEISFSYCDAVNKLKWKWTILMYLMFNIYSLPCSSHTGFWHRFLNEPITMCCCSKIFSVVLMLFFCFYRFWSECISSYRGWHD